MAAAMHIATSALDGYFPVLLLASLLSYMFHYHLPKRYGVFEIPYCGLKITEEI